MTSASTIAIWSQERIKAAADRAEARSRGETAEGYVESTAKVERLAKLSIFEFEQEREAAAEELGVRVRVLDEEVKRQRKKLGKSAKPTPRFDPDELERSASNIINHSDVLTLFAEAFNKVIAGEAVNGKLLYLVGTSRLFDKTMNAAVKGTSAGGKSEIRKRALDFFPPEDVITFTSLSEKSLIYYDGDFTHKVLSMGEATATEEQDFQDYLLRELMSEGHIRHSTVQKVGNEMVATTIEKEGPVAFLVTTTKSKLHPENETRMLSLEIDDSEDQTKKVLDKVAQVDGLHDIAPVDYKPWQDFQRWLGLGECRVVVPFAGVMVKMIPAVAVRLRRDVGQVICAIKAHGLIHRDQRDRNHAGRIVADIEHDYAAVRELMNAIVAEGSGVAVNPAMIETIKAVTTATVGMDDTEGANAKAVAKLLKLDRSAAWRRLSAACDEGYVVNLEQRERMPGKYRTTGQKAEPKVILPPTDDLAERYNTHLSLSPLKSVHSCTREEIAEVSLSDNECKPHLHSYAHGALADADRVHECSSVQTGLALDNSRNGNEKSPPVARVHEFSGDTDARVSIDDGATKFRSDIEDAHAELALRVQQDDLTIPPRLDRRHEVCAHCGQPGGTEWDYRGLKVRLHERCEQAWIEQVRQ